MAVDINEDFSFLSNKEIAKKIAKRIQVIRKKKFDTQELLAEHTGLSYSKISRFEKSGNIQFKDFLTIVKAIGEVSELQHLFEASQGDIKW
jgi:transcriptional regulator with XRE-family HTH domain